MEVFKSDIAPSAKGPSDWFTGNVRIDAPFKGTDGARISGATVTFEPNSRAHWHTHPLGQTLFVTVGNGFVQKWGEEIQPISAGDIVWIAPNEKHWHGANLTNSMTHLAIAEILDGNVVQWMEAVENIQEAVMQ